MKLCSNTLDYAQSSLCYFDADFNALTTPGVHTIIRGQKNAPSSYRNWSLTSAKTNLGRDLTQIAVENGRNNLYIRSYSSGKWSSWWRIPSKSDVGNLVSIQEFTANATWMPIRFGIYEIYCIGAGGKGGTGTGSPNTLKVGQGGGGGGCAIKKVEIKGGEQAVITVSAAVTSIVIKDKYGDEIASMSATCGTVGTSNCAKYEDMLQNGGEAQGGDINNRGERGNTAILEPGSVMIYPYIPQAGGRGGNPGGAGSYRDNHGGFSSGADDGLYMANLHGGSGGGLNISKYNYMGSKYGKNSAGFLGASGSIGGGGGGGASPRKTTGTYAGGAGGPGAVIIFYLGTIDL